MSAVSSSTIPEPPASSNEVTNQDNVAPKRPAEGSKPLLWLPRPEAPVIRRSLFRR